MKSVDIDQVSLEGCVREAQRDRVIIRRGGKPVALIIGVEGLDEEQLELGSSDRFWTFIGERRREKTMSRAELDEKIHSSRAEKQRAVRTKDGSQATAPSPPTPDAAHPASWVEKSPGVCGGDARIRKTRITVWGIVEWRSLGLSDAEILEHHPDLTQADLEVAWEYYGQNQEEIDQAIRENAEA